MVRGAILPHGRAGVIGAVSRSRVVRNGVATGMVWMAVALALVPLGFVLYYVIRKGAGVMSWDFLTKDIPTTRSLGPGMGPAVIGTLIITGGATAMAVPL